MIPGGDANALPGDILAIDRRKIYERATGHAVISAGKIGIRDSAGNVHRPSAGQIGLINPGAEKVTYEDIGAKRYDTDPAEGFNVRRVD